MWIIVVSIIFLMVLVMIVWGFSDGWSGFVDSVQNTLFSSERDQCATNVQQFCAQDGNTGADWTDRYPGCAQFEGDGGVLDNSTCH